MTEDDGVEALRAMLDAGDTQRDLARKAGVSEQFVGQVIKGRKRPGIRLLAVAGFRRKSGQSRLCKEIVPIE